METSEPQAHIAPEPHSRILIERGKQRARRVTFYTLVILLNIASTAWLLDIFYADGIHKAHGIMLALFAILNGLLTLGSMHAIFGAYDILRGRKRAVCISDVAKGLPGPLKSRYVVVMPVYNEDIVKVCGRVEAIYRSIHAAGMLEHFDFYILSDTTNIDIWVEEECAWANMCRKLNGFGKVYYRRRRKNENRKAGNIGDFVRKWGGHYESMLVLDADSLMDGGDIIKMARTMESYPRLGILQTPPKLIRGTSVFTRLQQFAMRLYGPLFVRGLNFWQLGSGSYWGHNAMIRVKPFSEFCELPALPGREPFGGRILSHDFVEAALMVREGWEVWLAWDIEGTYEEAPPTLIDHLKRDRRWCQGNLQHLWLIFARKFPMPSRAHLFMGIMAYLGSPLWFLFLVFGTWIAWERHGSKLSRLPDEGLSYAAKWFHITANQQMLCLITVVFSLLFLPKLLALLFALFNGKTRRSFGGGVALVIGALFETILSALLAPSVMITHTFMVGGMILGRSVSWGNQTRETDGTAWVDAAKFHGLTTLIGLGWSWMAWKLGPGFIGWMAPILLGMVFSIPMSVWTSRVRYGKALLRQRVFSIPEENNPPVIMNLADEAEAAVDAALTASHAARYGVVAAIVDPYVNGVHVSLLEHAEQDADPLECAEKLLAEGPKALGKDELADVMYHAPTVLALHRAVWSRPSDTIHAVWGKAVESYRIRSSETDAA